MIGEFGNSTLKQKKRDWIFRSLLKREDSNNGSAKCQVIYYVVKFYEVRMDRYCWVW